MMMQGDLSAMALLHPAMYHFIVLPHSATYSSGKAQYHQKVQNSADLLAIETFLLLLAILD